MLSRLKTNFDVSSRKCKEEQEREDEEKWKSLDVVVSSCPVYLFICDSAGMYTAVHIICVRSTNSLYLTKCI